MLYLGEVDSGHCRVQIENNPESERDLSFATLVTGVLRDKTARHKRENNKEKACVGLDLTDLVARFFHQRNGRCID